MVTVYFASTTIEIHRRVAIFIVGVQFLTKYLQHEFYKFFLKFVAYKKLSNLIFFKIMSISATQEWKHLEKLAEKYGKMSLRKAFDSDKKRFEEFNIRLGEGKNELLFDYSKNLINPEIMEGLRNLAKRANVEGMRMKMFGGEKINFTENRAVLHVALRHQGQFKIKIFTVVYKRKTVKI
jgi:hypothetical protein